MAGQEIKVAVDTNVLVRAVVHDHPAQSEIASRVLTDANLIAIAVPSLCELVWVLRRGYKFSAWDTAAAIRALLNAPNVQLDRPAVEAGLAMLDAGGDFADGVIAYEGRWLGGEAFVSFDQRAVEMLKRQGVSARVV
jgi:predicted nucleic-acid-binding protein